MSNNQRKEYKIELICEEWNTTKVHADTIQAAFEVYLKDRALISESFKYWNTYVSDLFPILRDLTNYLRSGNWILYRSAVERATSLFFFFGRTKYSRWTSLFLQDCYQLEKNSHFFFTPTRVVDLL